MKFPRALILGCVAVLVAGCSKKAPPAPSPETATALLPPSCARGAGEAVAGVSHCGPSRDSCCASLRVPGGTFARSYDGVTYRSPANPATVSTFRLDKYEVTVGRFRQFVNAVLAGYSPARGAGKHQHVNGGAGLNGELGWDSAWTVHLASTAKGWNEDLRCDRTATWTALPSRDDARAINCVDWVDAYAFCIWDGGFLPTEAEWNYAASGGSAQRVYPWSNPPGATVVDCSYANFSSPALGCSTAGVNDVGSDSPKGDALWGHADMAGNLWEWTLDVYDPDYVNPCQDCVNLKGGNRSIRGGSFLGDVKAPPASLLASFRSSDTATDRFGGVVGMRCARRP